VKQIAPNIYRYTTTAGRRYAVRYRLNGRRLWVKGFTSLDQARIYCLNKQTERTDAKHFPERVPALTLADYAPIWIKACTTRRLRHNTLRSYVQNLNDHVLPTLGNYPLNHILRKEIIALMRTKQAEDYSGHSIRLMIAPLSRLFSDAYDEGIVEANPCLRPGRILDVRKVRREIVALSASQRDTFLTTILQHHPDHYPMACVLFLAGLRIGEVMALERTDLRLAELELLVRFTFTNGRREPSTKNGRYRVIEIEERLAMVLAQHLERIQTIVPRSPLLFPGKQAMYLSERSWRRRIWDKMVHLAGVPRITPHCARHTYATLMLEAGKPIAWLSAQLGHSSISVTVDTYGHIRKRVRGSDEKEVLFTKPGRIPHADSRKRGGVSSIDSGV